MNLTARKGPVSAYALKWIAIVTMAVDHTGHVCRYLLNFSSGYFLMRAIGRIAFPIFAFLLVEGLRHTRNRTAYLRNLLIFAFISELPFDLALSDWAYHETDQNIFWTLSLGLLALLMMEEARERWRITSRPALLCGTALSVAALISLGKWANVDYGYYGVLLIVLVYSGELVASALSDTDTPPQFLLNIGAAVGILCWMAFYDFSHGWINEFRGAVCIPFILLYSGERGNYRLSKWFFYAFYPAHLLILYACQDTVFRWLLRG